MTEKEKALSGQKFIRGDKELKAQRDRAEKLCYELNQIPSYEVERRSTILKELIPTMKENCLIKSPFYCDYGSYISVGENFFANFDCKILDGGKVTFGDNVFIGPSCSFLTINHAVDPKERLMGYQIYKPITVGNNVWFGANVVVTPGVTIGDNSVIGAGSVVTKDIPSNVMACGNPCRVIKQI